MDLEPEPMSKILLLTPLYPPAYRGGGPIRTTEAMVDTHAEKHEFYVITSDTDWGESDPLPVETDSWVTRGAAKVLYTRKSRTTSLLRALVAGARQNPDYLYANSFLSPRFSIVPILLSKLRLFGSATIVVAPRGEFGEAALAIKSRKKSLFIRTAKILGIHKRIIWHASSTVEAEEIRKHFRGSRIVVRLDESGLPPKPIRHTDGVERPVKLAFVSRISEIKGVTLLLEALGNVKSTVTIDLYGSAQNPTYLKRCTDLARNLPSNITANFKGSIENSMVRDIFANADAFFLPTEHENFCHAIAESLSAGTPVFVENVTPWTDVIEAGGGRIVPEHTVQAWTDALQTFCNLDTVARGAMKLRAADAYEEWHLQSAGPSVFELIESVDETPTS